MNPSPLLDPYLFGVPQVGKISSVPKMAFYPTTFYKAPEDLNDYDWQDVSAHAITDLFWRVREWNSSVSFSVNMSVSSQYCDFEYDEDEAKNGGRTRFRLIRPNDPWPAPPKTIWERAEDADERYLPCYMRKIFTVSPGGHTVTFLGVPNSGEAGLGPVFCFYKPHWGNPGEYKMALSEVYMYPEISVGNGLPLILRTDDLGVIGEGMFWAASGSGSKKSFAQSEPGMTISERINTGTLKVNFLNYSWSFPVYGQFIVSGWLYPSYDLYPMPDPPVFSVSGSISVSLELTATEYFTYGGIYDEDTGERV